MKGGGSERKPGRVTAVFATKGGVGVTTVATNLAVCLAQREASTLLIDLDARQSDVATFLNLRSSYSVLDAFENVGRMDESFLRGLLVRHSSGLWVLPGPSRIERIQFGAEPVRVGIEIMRSHFDHVIVDLRPGSPTWRQWQGVELTAENRHALWVPPLCAHGYLTLTDDTELQYGASASFDPAAARGVRWDDPALAIEWPEQVRVISERDQTWPLLNGEKA